MEEESDVYVINEKEKTDDRLLPCALCGGQAFYRNNIVIGRGSTGRGDPPEGTVAVKEIRNPAYGHQSGAFPTKKIWERRGYGVHCMTPNCGRRTVLGGKRTLEEAIEAWNGNRLTGSSES